MWRTRPAVGAAALTAAGTGTTHVVVGNFIDLDGRAEILNSLGLSAVVLGESIEMAGIASVFVDNYGAMMDAVTFLGERGHRSIGRVSGP